MLAQWLDPANERVPPDAPEEQMRAWVAQRSVGCRGNARPASSSATAASTSTRAFGEWELSYGFRRDRWGRGYATEAARACVRHGFDELGLEKIVADVDPANVASMRVLEKCGFDARRELDDGRLVLRGHAVSSSPSSIRPGATSGGWNLSEYATWRTTTAARYAAKTAGT